MYTNPQEALFKSLASGLSLQLRMDRYPSVEAFCKDDNEPASYVFLAKKLQKHMDSNNLDKVKLYAGILFRKDVNKAPDEVKDVGKSVFSYLKSNGVTQI